MYVTMTFYDAALKVLQDAGAPLHYNEITQRSVSQGLLSHVGKAPDVTMLARLVSMARRARDRRVIVTAKDTFALVDWQLPEDPAALQETGVALKNPEEDLPPLRGSERHPEARAEYVRTLQRHQSDHQRRRRDEAKQKRRRFPPLAEVAFEFLSESNEPMAPLLILERALAREQVGPDLTQEKLITALVSENQRRIDDGRRPQFVWVNTSGVEGDGQLALDTDPARDAAEIQQALCTIAQIPFENGRAVLPQSRDAAPIAAPSAEDQELQHAARHAVKEARRAMARQFRARLAALDPATLERAIMRLLKALRFREIRVQRRTKDGPVLGARRTDGSLEMRFVIRLARGNANIERRHVHELRREVGQANAHVGLLCSTGDLRGDARGDALGGGSPIMVYAGEGLAEKFFEAEVGVESHRLSLVSIDDTFFDAVAIEAQEHLKRRELRREERERTPTESVTPPPMAAPSAPGVPVEGIVEFDADAGGADEGDDEGEAGGEGGSESANPSAPGAPTDGTRRRRRRRRRGRRRDGAPGQPGAPGGQGASAAPGSSSGEAASSGGATASASPPQSSEPQGGGDA